MDVVVTVPMNQWQHWIAEGDLPGEPESGNESHFWVSTLPSNLSYGDRVYVVSYGRLRGYAPLWGVEESCLLNPSRSCLVRRGEAVALTIPVQLRGFRGWRYRWWDREDEVPFANWMTEGFG